MTFLIKPTLASIRAALIVIEGQLAVLALASAPAKALRLDRAADLLIEARACDLWKLR
jgi:hypothetical protein